MAAESQPRRLRCAIYTRKSTEEGLDQAFNSLDAQHEACAAYVLSQRHEGWNLLPDLYDDGGFTGGNMLRPGLKRLMDDVKAGRVDVVVVYKVDRLTRSLADFAKIVDVLDEAKASFVSVTQAFNTTSSMGRLTLNVLLSFAQFEREVISERIRDKVAASKAKGMWMGGVPPLGYDVVDKQLVANADEAKTVGMIMERYLASDCVRTLLIELERDGVVSKVRHCRNGKTYGSIPIQRGALYHLLANRAYIGETVHHRKWHPGKHEPIVDKALFDAVQSKLAERTSPSAPKVIKRTVSLLAGMIRDEHGRPMSPMHTNNHGRRYRYYASNLANGSTEPALRLPAGDLDAAIKAGLRSLLSDGLRMRVLAEHLSPTGQLEFVAACADRAPQLAGLSTAEARAVLGQLGTAVVVSRDSAKLLLSSKALFALLELPAPADDVPLGYLIATDVVGWGQESRLRLDPPAGVVTPKDTTLIQLIARGFAARDELLAMDAEAAKELLVTRQRHLERIARLSYLAPDIVRAILDGQQPRHITARGLAKIHSLPMSWAEQREMLGFVQN